MPRITFLLLADAVKNIYVTVSKNEGKWIVKMWKTLYYIRKSIFTVFIATVLIALGAALTSVYTLERYEAVSAEGLYDTNIKDVVAENDAVCYYVKEYDGIIGVYDLSGELMYTVEVYIKTLPEADRALLAEGLRADSYGELLEILGDYTD